MSPSPSPTAASPAGAGAGSVLGRAVVSTPSRAHAHAHVHPRESSRGNLELTPPDPSRDRTNWDRFRPSPFPLPGSPSPAPSTPSTTGTSQRTPLRFSTTLNYHAGSSEYGFSDPGSADLAYTHQYAHGGVAVDPAPPNQYLAGGQTYDFRDSRGELGIDVRTSLSDYSNLSDAYSGLDAGLRAMSVDADAQFYPTDNNTNTNTNMPGADPFLSLSHPQSQPNYPPQITTRYRAPSLTSASSNSPDLPATPGLFPDPAHGHTVGYRPVRGVLPIPGRAEPPVAGAAPDTHVSHFWALPPGLQPVPAPLDGDNPYQTDTHLRPLLQAYPTLGPVFVSSTKFVEEWYRLCERRWQAQGGSRYWPDVPEWVNGVVRRSADPGAMAGAAGEQGRKGSIGGGMDVDVKGADVGQQVRKPQHYSFAEFEWSRTLGTGTFGRVHLVRSLHNSRLFAIKVLSKSKIVSLSQVEHTNSERSLLLAASSPSSAAYDSSNAGRCPFLVNLYGTWKDSTNVYMVMEYVSGGELFTLLRRAERFPVSVARFYAAEVVLALGYLHRMDIIYRDLKPENILLSPSGHIKLTDFGFAKYVPDITFTLCGTPDYLAPELIAHMPYTKSVDWYSLGILVYEMLVGTPPFVAPNPPLLYQRILDGRVVYPREQIGEIEIAFLQRTMTKDLSRRYGHGKVSDRSRMSISSISSAQSQGQGAGAGGAASVGDGTEDVMRDEFFSGIHWETLEGSAGEYFGRGGGIRVPWIPGEGENFERYNEVDFAEYNQAFAAQDEFAEFFPDF